MQYSAIINTTRIIMILLNVVQHVMILSVSQVHVLHHGHTVLIDMQRVLMDTADVSTPHKRTSAPAFVSYTIV